jgi:sodium-coupled neutral amino acid transporter 11
VELACFHPKLQRWDVRTYEDLLSFPFGRYGSAFILGSMLIFAYGAMIAYLLIIKDTVPTILGIGSEIDSRINFLKRDIILIVTTSVVVFPLALQRDMAHLAFTSFWSVIADVILVVFIAVYSPISTTLHDAGGFWQAVFQNNFINSHIFVGLGIFSSAMACQHCAFIVSGSLEDPTAGRWASVTFRSVSIATVLCAVLGVTGYLGFLSATQGDVLNSFRSDTVVANGARVLLAVTMFFTYPMEAFVARHVVIKLLFNGDIDGETIDDNGQMQPEVKFCGCFGRRETTTLVIYLATLLPALLVNNLGPVLSITGALGGSCISYIGPGLVYLGVNSDFFLEWVAQMLNERKVKMEPPQGDLELPVVGEAESKLHSSLMFESRSDCFRPWWWWLAGFPIWCYIASCADQGMKTKLASITDPARPSSETLFLTEAPHNHESPIVIVGPSKTDCIISIFLVVFGVIAAVVGVASNVYVEVKNTFYTP